MKSIFCFLVAATVFVATAYAQDDREKGRSGGPGRGPGGQGDSRGGFGGPGGGGGFGGGFGDPSMLLRNEEVRKELEIDEDQLAALTEIGKKSMPERPEGVNMREMDEEARKKFFAEMQAKMQAKAKEVKEQVAEVLTPGQLDRLNQISIQVRGAGALQDPEVAAALKITDEQKKQLTEKGEEVREKMREKMREAFTGGKGGPEAFQTLRTEMETEVLSVLTEEQRKEFESMKGEKFEMSMGWDRGQRGGGDRGPGDRGGRGDRPDGERPSKGERPAKADPEVKDKTEDLAQ
jgi:Spy/CpxP family protein refolding chaperone